MTWPGSAKVLQPRGLAWRLADHLAVRVGDDEAACHADPDRQPGRKRHLPHGLMLGEGEGGVERALGGVFLRHRIAEIGEHLAHPASRQHAAMLGDDGGGITAIGIDEGAQLLRIARQVASFGREHFRSESGDEASFAADGARLGQGRASGSGVARSLRLPHRAR